MFLIVLQQKAFPFTRSLYVIALIEAKVNLFNGSFQDVKKEFKKPPAKEAFKGKSNTKTMYVCEVYGSISVALYIMA